MSESRRYLEWNFDEGLIREYERQGECNSCGQCCIAFIHYRHSSNPRTRELGETITAPLGDGAPNQGIIYEVSEGEFRRMMIPIAIEPRPRDHACPQLQMDNRCAVHDRKNWKQDELSLCDVWPINPAQVTPFDQCSYTFTQIGEWGIE